MDRNKLVVVTGVGMRKAARLFRNTDSADHIDYQGETFKLNAAAGASIELGKAGHVVYMVGTNEAYLKHLDENLVEGPSRFAVVNLLDREATAALAQELTTLAHAMEADLHVVHYGGVSEVDVELPDNTVFLDPWRTPPPAITDVVASNTVTLLNLLQELRDTFRVQSMTKVVIITAVAAKRTARFHGLDAIQKAACHAMARSLALDLTREKIFVTEVMPGMTDTGFYDSDATFTAMSQAGREYGYEWTEETFPLFSSRKVGQAVRFAIDTDAHVRELSLIPYGQFPHLGA
ncbi:SDR family oxidoreductase [Streptomyces sp. NPDC005500]|uniref:SDR family oxidoreductase n=1 Tax=Streptomyces sp. NPDC005500 TaxID=3155007 RepID=UPI0033B41541